MFDEAADWLYAWRTVLAWYDDSLKDEQHPLAQALRPHAKPSTLPGSPYTAERALRPCRTLASQILRSKPCVAGGGKPSSADSSPRKWNPWKHSALSCSGKGCR